MKHAALVVLALASTAAAQPLGDRTRAQLDAVADAVAPYRDFEVAKARGWKQFGGEDTPLMGEHWVQDGGPDYVAGDRFDFSRPSNLMYTDIGGKKVLTGVAFTVRLAPGDAVPEGFAGAADRWHVHDFERAIGAALVDRPILRWLANAWLDANYRSKGDDRGRIAMVHAWVTLPNPDGVFADYNRTLPYLKLGLPARFAEGASIEAANGLDLVTPAGCKNALEGGLWIANVKRDAAKQLRNACADAAAHVREGVSSREPRRINAMAEHGWMMFEAARDKLLTPEQQGRIAAVTEHGGHDMMAADDGHMGHH